ncbi:hypothetical protein SDJN02_24536, partial [Cucurbita argyrosperma subsp. argyrosperma]
MTTVDPPSHHRFSSAVVEDFLEERTTLKNLVPKKISPPTAL